MIVYMVLHWHFHVFKQKHYSKTVSFYHPWYYEYGLKKKDTSWNVSLCSLAESRKQILYVNHHTIILTGLNRGLWYCQYDTHDIYQDWHLSGLRGWGNLYICYISLKCHITWHNSKWEVSLTFVWCWVLREKQVCPRQLDKWVFQLWVLLALRS